MDPDEQVQTVMRLVFDKFHELGSCGAVLRYLVQHDVRLVCVNMMVLIVGNFSGDGRVVARC